MRNAVMVAAAVSALFVLGCPAKSSSSPSGGGAARKVSTPSGEIEIQDLTVGSGDSPTAASTVKVHYRGTLEDGTEFDSSYKRGEPIEFGLGQVIPCWTHGVQQMKVGGKAKLTCPYQTAYGEMGRPPVIPPRAKLLFEVELLGVR